MELATYYVTLKPTKKDGKPADGMYNIAYVNDPAIEEVGVYLNRHDQRIVANEKIQEEIINYLKTVGIKKPDHWKEVSEEEYLEARKVNLSNDPKAQESYNDLTKADGTGQWLVRYKYDGPKDSKNRTFCAQILSLDRIYTEEEIKNGLSNPEFGNYSIFDYKGSYGCRHVWKRLIYFEDYEDDKVRKVGFVPRVVSRLDDSDATTLNAFLSTNEKMQVVAPLLIPDKDIFRDDELGRYNMRFSTETIKDLQKLAEEKKLFESKSLFKDTHQGETAPSYTIDQWIIEDENDKAYTDYGFTQKECPVGTWMVHSQITDRQFWQQEIKQNKKYAYSIEALINMTIIEMQTQKQINMEEEKIVLPDGEHLINGKIYVIVDGVVTSTKEVTPEQEEVVEEVAEKKAEEDNAEELKEDKPKEEMEEMPKDEKPKEEMQEEVVDEVKDDEITALKKQMDDLVTMVAEIKNQKEEVKEEVEVEMSDNRPLWKKISDAVSAIQK